MKTCKNLPIILITWLLPVCASLDASAGGDGGDRLHGPDRQFFLQLLTLDPGNIESPLDDISVLYNNGYLRSTADDDLKTAIAGENIASYRWGLDLSAERRPLFSLTDTIFLHITNTTARNYRFKIHMQNFSVTGLLVKLEDNYLHTSRVLATYGSTDNIDFSVNSDPASADPFRFRIVFLSAATLPVNITAFTAVWQGTNSSLEWKVSNELNILRYEIERSADGIYFTTEAVVPATRSSAYNWQDLLPLTGNNFYRLRCAGIAGDVKLSQVIRVKAGNSAAGISVYTNPVVNHTLALQFTRMERGTYRVNLLNAGGQLLSTNSLLHGGGTALQILLLQQGIPGGNYLLQVIHPGQATTTQKLLIAE